MRKNGKWVLYVAGRFGTVDYRGRSALTSLLSALGIAFGVTALIVVLSVMNGFQLGYIENILEVSSAHVRLTGTRSDIDRIGSLPGVRSVTVFSESQALMEGKYARQEGALLRAVPENVLTVDRGFASRMQVPFGSFDISRKGTVVLGYELAQMLSVKPGDTVSVIAVSGDSSTDLFPENAALTVSGLYKTGYYAIDSTLAFVSDKTAAYLSGSAAPDASQGTMAPVLAACKLDNPERDAAFLALVAARFPNVKAESWRSYNRAFFGALRVEKNMLFLLVILIFVVVTVNIYNGMRRAVYERREEISVLTALGGSPRLVRSIFIMNGLGIGLSGGILGLLTGLLVSVRINSVFSLAEKIVNGANHFVSALLSLPPGQEFTIFSPEYFYLDKVPIRMLFPEVLFVFLFGVLSAAAAAWMASRSITRLKPAEVLRYE
ncbi:MAG TPA: ABC transporter permease [Treponemataceae bacterium]|nr:ABC transporter permease [Treponemataceae bacterium]